jgi:acid phosphatase type 7
MNPPMMRSLRSRTRVAFVVASTALLSGILLFPRPAGATGDPVIAAAGDIACDPSSSKFNGGNGTATACHEKSTGNQLLTGVSNGAFNAVLALGDTQYECGGYQAYLQSYDPTWGQVLWATYPVVGNHEYNTRGGTDCGSGASGYFRYFYPSGSPPTGGYYSFDIGTWHLIALNANCSFVACKKGSPQEQWLANDLATHPNTCTLAFWHQPRFSVGPTTLANVLPFWNDLYAAHADVVVNGHKHNYERLTKLNPIGSPDPSGIREFIAGTGGVNRSIGSRLYPGTEASDGKHFGILELTLHPTTYDWQFVADDGSGSVLDSGSDACVN